ncbi:ribosome assembly RNA-binding protein YhbY [Lachnospiraceae bacterium 45-W7]
MTSKQRAYLKKLASNVHPVFQIGKSSLTPEMVTAVDEALEKRELIKLSVLKNCFDEPQELAQTLADRTRSQVVHVIGKKIVLYRPAKKNPKIELPQA